MVNFSKRIRWASVIIVVSLLFITGCDSNRKQGSSAPSSTPTSATTTEVALPVGAVRGTSAGEAVRGTSSGEAVRPSVAPSSAPEAKGSSAIPAPIGALDFLGARTKAETTEKALAGIDYKRDLGPRGFGGVMTAGLTPRKILAARPDRSICDGSGSPLEPLKSCAPYFVFDEDGGKLLIGQVQERDLARGWVNVEACYPWPNRRMAYPKMSGPVKFQLTDPRGVSTILAGDLPTFDPKIMMPWPILATTPERTLIVLADLHCLGGPQAPVELRNPSDFEVYVQYSQREIDEALKNLTRLSGVLDKLPAGDVPRVLGSFITQNNCDFLDLSEVQATLDLYPGGVPDLLVKRELAGRMKSLERILGRQIDQLLRVANSTDQFNEGHFVYLVPCKDLLKEEKFK